MNFLSVCIAFAFFLYEMFHSDRGSSSFQRTWIPDFSSLLSLPLFLHVLLNLFFSSACCSAALNISRKKNLYTLVSIFREILKQIFYSSSLFALPLWLLYHTTTTIIPTHRVCLVPPLFGQRHHDDRSLEVAKKWKKITKSSWERSQSDALNWILQFTLKLHALSWDELKLGIMNSSKKSISDLTGVVSHLKDEENLKFQLDENFLTWLFLFSGNSCTI